MAQSSLPLSRSSASPPRWANVLLLAVAVLFLASHMLPGGGWALGLLRAASEAALVGGLADWFAVVALFRRPLGLPIPHTAVIPSNKDRIGDSLGAFVEQNFLDPDLIAGRLIRAEPARRVGLWLAHADNARWLADRVADAVAIALRGLQDRELKAFVGTSLQREMQGFSLAPLIGRALRLLVESDRHQDLIDEILERATETLVTNEDTVLNVVESKSAWWVPKQVDRRVAGALTRGLIDLLRDLKQRDHELRVRAEQSFAHLIDDLERDPALNARIVEWTTSWTGRPEFERFAERLWTGLRERLEHDLATERSAIRNGISEVLTSLGRSIATDRAMQAKFDEKVTSAAKTLLVPWRHEIGAFISEVVKSWDARTITERLESAVGRDLQYIRINGTLVGALVGCVLFALSHLMF